MTFLFDLTTSTIRPQRFLMRSVKTESKQTK